MSLPTIQAREDLFDLYCRSRYDARLPGGERATLQIGELVPEALRSWVGNDWPLLFISACNPHSRELQVKANRRRMQALLARLDQTHARRLVGVGHVSHPSWREPSLLVAGLPLKTADLLAQEFGQNAIVVATNTMRAKLRIYRNEWRDRLRDRADIDWVQDSGVLNIRSCVT